MPQKTIHVVPSQVRGWNVKKGGCDKAIAHYNTKQQAIDAARNISRKLGTELYIHNLDGRIGQKDSHGNDNFPPRG